MPSLAETPFKPQVGQPGANLPRTLFGTLYSLVHRDPTSPEVEITAAHLAARVAAHPAQARGVCVGILRNHEFTSVHGPLAVLKVYGITPSFQYLERHARWLVFLEVNPGNEPHPFEGAMVKARTYQVTELVA